MDPESRIVVIGGSAGALEPLIAILSELPPDLDMAYFVVIHYPANRTSMLPTLLNRTTRLRASYAQDGEHITAGTVYVPHSDRHLVVDDGRVGVINGPKENASRPSIDVLFRSAALSAGSRVVGVVLSGSLDDGSAGLLTIAKHGGRTIAQDPDEAMFPEMPRNAAGSGKAQSVLSTAAIASTLVQIAKGGQPEHAGMNNVSKTPNRDLNGMPEDEPFASPSPFVCPECEGTLWQLRDESLERYRCRVGHAYSQETLWEQKAESLEAALWAASRALQEQADLSKRIADNARSRNTTLAERYDHKRRAAQAAQRTVREVLLNLRPNDDAALEGSVADGTAGTGAPPRQR